MNKWLKENSKLKQRVTKVGTYILDLCDRYNFDPALKLALRTSVMSLTEPIE